MNRPKVWQGRLSGLWYVTVDGEGESFPTWREAFDHALSLVTEPS